MNDDLLDDITTGTYTLTASVTCQGACASTDAKTATKIIKITTKPVVTPGTIVVDPTTVCAKNNSRLTLPDASCSTGSKPVIKWYQVDNATSIGSGETFDVNKDVTTETDFKYYATVTCGTSPCDDTKQTANVTVTVKPNTTQDVTVTGIPANQCQGLPGTITGVATTNCNDFTFDFKVVDVDKGIEYPGTGTVKDKNRTIIVANLPAGNYRVEYILTCNDTTACVTPNPKSSNNAGTFTIKEKFETPMPTIAQDDEVCENKDTLTLTSSLAFPDTAMTDCPEANRTYQWIKTVAGAESNLPADENADNTTYNTKNLTKGTYKIKLKVSCTKDCSTTPNPHYSNEITVTVKPETTQSVTVTGIPTDQCQKTPGTITGRATTACSIPYFSFRVIGDDLSEHNGTGGLVKTIDVSTLEPGTYHVEYTLRCDDLKACVTPNPLDFTYTTKFKINPLQEAPDDISAEIKPDDTLCTGEQAERNIITATALWNNDDDKMANCTNLSYEWYQVEVPNSVRVGTGKTLDVNSLNLTPRANPYAFKVRVKCGQPCPENEAWIELPADKYVDVYVKQGAQAGKIKSAQDFCIGEEGKPTTLVTDVDDAKGYDEPANEHLYWERATMTGDTCNNDWSHWSNLCDGSQSCADIDKTTSYCYRRKAINECNKTGNVSNVIKVKIHPRPMIKGLSGPGGFCSANQSSMAYMVTTTDCDLGTVTFSLVDKADSNNPKRVIKTGTFNISTNSPTALYTLANPELLYGVYTLTATLNCSKPCVIEDVYPKPTTFFDIEVYDCRCGSANGKTFVGGAITPNTLSQTDITGTTNDTKFKFCKDGCVAKAKFPPPLDPPFALRGDGWDWYCQCGSGISLNGPNCNAKQTKCGTASAEGSGTDRIYTDDSWSKTTKGTICINGTLTPTNLAATDLLNSDEPDGNSCNGGGDGTGIKDTWKWNCVDSVNKPTIDCTAKRLDCGVADANRVLKNNCEIQPKVGDSEPYRGSYSSEPLTSHLCTLSLPGNTNPLDTERGKWSWECGQDSLGDKLSCEARKDCGWAGTYPTVEYNSGGCWTAKNVKDGVGNTRFNWGVATNIAPALWANCKGIHCKSLLDQISYQQGICPSGYEVPTQNAWHGLEDKLQKSACSPTRWSLTPPGAWSCSPAGNGNVDPGYGNDGLKDGVTFAGVSGENYWTRTYGFNTAPLCGSAGTCKCQKTLYYYGLDNSNNVNRTADDNNCTSSPAHQLRCIKKISGGLIGGGGGDTQQCYGWGCSNQFIGQILKQPSGAVLFCINSSKMSVYCLVNYMV